MPEYALTAYDEDQNTLDTFPTYVVVGMDFVRMTPHIVNTRGEFERVVVGTWLNEYDIKHLEHLGMTVLIV